MFLVIAFLCLSAVGATLFPELSWTTVLLVSFTCVAAFRLLLFFADHAGKVQQK